MCKILVPVIFIACLGLAACTDSTPTETSVATVEPSAPVSTEAPTEAAALTEEVDPWAIVRQVELQRTADGPNYTNSAGFFGEEIGIAGGGFQEGYGEIYYTSDGGETWSQTCRGSSTFSSVEIVDDDLIWALGLGEGHISVDGGQSWEKVFDIPCRGEIFDFVDAQTGWVLCPVGLLATRDGGQTWAEIAEPEGAGPIVSVALRTANDGYLLDDAGTLYVTSDGGQSWSTRSLGLSEGETIIFVGSRMSIVRFSDADHGVVITSFMGQGDVVALRTADGGLTWERENIPAKIGTLHLTPDGTVLTVTKPGTPTQITVLRYRGS